MYEIKWEEDGSLLGTVIKDGMPVTDADSILLMKPMDHADEDPELYENKYDVRLDPKRWYFVCDDGTYEENYYPSESKTWTDVIEVLVECKLYELNSASNLFEGEIRDAEDQAEEYRQLVDI